MRITAVLLVSGLLFIGACSDDEKQKTKQSSPRIKSLVSINSPKSTDRIFLGDTISFNVGLSDSNLSIDSIQLSTPTGHLSFQDNIFSFPTSGMPLGKVQLSLKVFIGDKEEQKRVTVRILSNEKPKNYTYQVKAQHPHDRKGFVQGLFFDGDNLYESTGQEGESQLREIELASGNIKRSFDLPIDLFGEGSTVLGDKIYILTWHAGKGFVINKNTFEPMAEIYYPTQGWGLTVKEDTLIMSDGTEVIRFMEPDGFTQVKKIEVYDDAGPIKSLNELEYINGRIYANRWLTNYIYVIDPSNGKVEGVIDMTGLLPEDQVRPETDVLNGIAYNSLTNRIYVTGKYWPSLFEVEFIEATKNL